MSESVQTLLDCRYGNGHLLDNSPVNAVIEGLLRHRSVRRFSDQPLPEGILQTLVAAAQSASTSSNLQLWSLVAVHDPQRKERLSRLAGNQKHIIAAPLFLVWLADLSRISRMAERESMTLEGVPYLECFLMASVDAALAAQNAVVALESLGLGAVFVGGIRNDISAVAAELALPQEVYPVFGMSIGVPDPSHPSQIKPRLSQAAVVHGEQYATDEEVAAIADYDKRQGDFYAEHGLQGTDWSCHVLARLQTVQALTGRDQLTEKLHRLGFGLR